MWINSGLVLSVVIGMITGGMFVFYLVTDHERNRRLFGLLTLCFAVLSIATLLIGGGGTWQEVLGAFSVLLSALLGYATTTYLVINRPQTERNTTRADLERPTARAQTDPLGKLRPAIIIYTEAEPEQYQTRQVSDSYDYRNRHGLKVPPPLLRPFAMRRLRDQYRAVGTSPQRREQTAIAQKVQEKLGRRYRVYIAFVDDRPALDEMTAAAIADGYRYIVVSRPRISPPPAGSSITALLGSLNLDRHGVSVRDAAPLHTSATLAKGLAAQVVTVADPDTAGVLLLGAQVPEEAAFRQRVSHALTAAGFAEGRVATAYTTEPGSLAAAFGKLRACPTIAVLPTDASDSLASHNLLRRLRAVQRHHAPVASLQLIATWSDDDSVVLAIIESIKAVLGENDGPTAKPELQPVHRAGQS